jgi:hypothetical protein
VQGVYNPSAATSAQKSVQGEAERWLTDAASSTPALAAVMPMLREAASACLEDWAAHFLAVVRGQKEGSEEEEVQTALAKMKSKEGAKAMGETETGERTDTLRRDLRKAKRTGFLRFVKTLAAHPILGIFLARPSDTFSLGDMMMLQVNVSVIMLCFSVAFYYAKAVACCQDQKQYLGCTEGMDDDCLG